MSFIVLSEFDQMKNFFPEFDMAINTEGDNEISLAWSYYIVDDILMHVTYLISFTQWQILQQKIVKIH